MYGFSTGFLRFRDDVLAKGSQEPVRLPYGYRTVTVRCMHGSVRCMCEHRTDPYVLETTRRILRSLYVARTGPGDGREGTYEFLAPYDCLRAFYGEKKMCMHNFQTLAVYGYKGSIRAEKLRRTPCGPDGPCGPVRYAVRSPSHGSLEFWPLRCP